MPKPTFAPSSPAQPFGPLKISAFPGQRGSVVHAARFHRAFTRVVFAVAVWTCVNCGGAGLARPANDPVIAALRPTPENATPPVLSLSDARRIAFERNWDLLAAKANVDLAFAQKIVAREFPNPTASFSTSKLNADSRPSGTAAGNGVWDRNYDTILAVSQLFEIGGKRAARQSSAAAGHESAEASFRDARRTLDLAVTKAFIAALLAEENVRVLKKSSASLRHEATIAETRLNAGDISSNDRNQIEIAAERLELDAAAAGSNAATARIALEVLLGTKSPSGKWKPANHLGQLASASRESRGGSSGVRPDLAAAQATQRKTDADLRLQKAMRIPDPTGQLLYEHQPPDQPNTVGFGVSLPLPLWNFNRGNIRAAEAARDQAQAQASKIETQIASEIAAAEIAYREAFARWRRYLDQIAPSSAAVVATVSFAYQKGGASLLDLLFAERNDNEIRVATAQAMADCATTSATLAIARNASPFTNSPENETRNKSHAPPKR